MLATYASLRAAVIRFITAGEGSFEDLAREIHVFQFRKNSPYQQFCRLRGIGERVSEWKDIPAVPQQAFKSSRLTTFAEVDTIGEFRTSGTTGEGYGSHYFCDLSLYHAAIAGGWKAAGLPDLPRLLLTPSPQEAAHSSLSHMMGELGGRFYLRDGKLQDKALRSDVAAADGPVLMLGTALAFLNLMEKSPVPLRLPTGSGLLETGGYKGSGRTLSKEEFYAQLVRYFGIETDAMINEYGMTELSSQFYSHGLGRVHQSGPWLRFRVVQPLTGADVGIGEMGILQLYDLANVGSVLAIQTEDLAVREVDSFRLLGRDPSAVARGCSRSADDLLNR